MREKNASEKGCQIHYNGSIIKFVFCEVMPHITEKSVKNMASRWL